MANIKIGSGKNESYSGSSWNIVNNWFGNMKINEASISNFQSNREITEYSEIIKPEIDTFSSFDDMNDFQSTYLPMFSNGNSIEIALKDLVNGECDDEWLNYIAEKYKEDGFTIEELVSILFEKHGLTEEDFWSLSQEQIDNLPLEDYSALMNLMTLKNNGFGQVKIVEIVRGTDGFSAVVLQDENGEYMINYTGTEDPSTGLGGLEDVLFDGNSIFADALDDYNLKNLDAVQQALYETTGNILESQKRQALDLANKYLSADGDDRKLHFFGYSLGGSLVENTVISLIESNNKDKLGNITTFNGLHANLSKSQIEELKKLGDDKFKIFAVQGDIVNVAVNYEDYADFTLVLNCDFESEYAKATVNVAKATDMGWLFTILTDEYVKGNIVNIDESLYPVLENIDYFMNLFNGGCHSWASIQGKNADGGLIYDNFDLDGNFTNDGMKPMSPDEVLEKFYGTIIDNPPKNAFTGFKKTLINLDSSEMIVITQEIIDFWNVYKDSEAAELLMTYNWEDFEWDDVKVVAALEALVHTPEYQRIANHLAEIASNPELVQYIVEKYGLKTEILGLDDVYNPAFKKLTTLLLNLSSFAIEHSPQIVSIWHSAAQVFGSRDPSREDLNEALDYTKMMFIAQPGLITNVGLPDNVTNYITEDLRNYIYNNAPQEAKDIFDKGYCADASEYVILNDYLDTINIEEIYGNSYDITKGADRSMIMHTLNGAKDVYYDLEMIVTTGDNAKLKELFFYGDSKYEIENRPDYSGPAVISRKWAYIEQEIIKEKMRPKKPY